MLSHVTLCRVTFAFGGGVRGREQVAADGGALPHGPSREAQDSSDTFRAHSRGLGMCRSFFLLARERHDNAGAKRDSKGATTNKKAKKPPFRAAGSAGSTKRQDGQSSACCCDASRCETELYLHGNLEASANPCGLLGRQDGLRKSRQHNAPKNEHEVSNSPAAVLQSIQQRVTHRERTRSSTRKQQSAVCYKATVEPRDRNR